MRVTSWFTGLYDWVCFMVAQIFSLQTVSFLLTFILTPILILGSHSIAELVTCSLMKNECHLTTPAPTGHPWSYISHYQNRRTTTAVCQRIVDRGDTPLHQCGEQNLYFSLQQTYLRPPGTPTTRLFMRYLNEGNKIKRSIMRWSFLSVHSFKMFNLKIYLMYFD